MSQARKFLIMSLLPLAVLGSPQPVITAPPIVQRQATTDEAFIGYYNTHGMFNAWYCSSGYKFSTSGNYGRCCYTDFTRCPMPTRCTNGSLAIYNDGDTGTCTSTAYPSCVTDIISNNVNDPSSINFVLCGSAPMIVYRTTPGNPTTSSDTTTTATSTPTPTSTATPTPAPSRSSSKAWIAGAAVGGVVAIAIVGALLFYFLRRKSNPSAPAPQQPTYAPFQPYMVAVPAQGPPMGGPDMTHQQQAHMSMPGSPPPQYLHDMQGKPPVAAGDFSPQQQMGMYQPQAVGPMSPAIGQPEQMPPRKGAAELQGH